MPRLTLPLPPRELKVNRTIGGHWAIHHSLRVAYQLQVMRALKDQRKVWAPLDWQYPIHVTVTAYLGKGQRADCFDIAGWAKSGIDSVVETGIWPDDSSKYIRPVTLDVQRDAANPRVELQW